MVVVGARWIGSGDSPFIVREHLPRNHRGVPVNMSSSYGAYDYGPDYGKSISDNSGYGKVNPNSGSGVSNPKSSTNAPGTTAGSGTGGPYAICIPTTGQCYAYEEFEYVDTGYLFFMCIWAVFLLVFVYYLAKRRAKLEYGILLLFSIGTYLC